MKKETWNFWSNILIQMYILLVAEASRGIVLPSLFLYVMAVGGDRRSLGIIVGGFSLGRLVGGILLGWIYNKKGTRFALFVALVLSIIGNILYVFGETNLWILLPARVFVGFGTGTLTVVRANIADVTTKEQRVRFLAFAGAVQFIGFAITPGLGLIMNIPSMYILNIPLNSYTLPAFVLLFANLIVLIIAYFLVPEGAQYIEEPEDKNPRHIIHDPPHASGMLYFLGIALFLALNFLSRGVISLVETVGGILYLKIGGDDPNENDISNTSQMFVILGCCGLIFFLLVDFLRKKIPDLVLLTISLIILGIGSFFLVPWNEQIQMWHFYVGCAFIWSIASPLTQTLVISSFSKMLRHKKQGTMMGLIGAAGSVGRMIVPSLSGFLSDKASFLVAGSGSILGALLTVVYWVLNNRYNI